MYVDDDTHGRRWISDRKPDKVGDPLRRAAEHLAKDVEHFLYDRSHEFFRDPKFLAVALRRFDITKSGSGNYPDLVGEITADVIAEAEVDPFPDVPQSKQGRRHVNTAIRLDDDSREMLASEDTADSKSRKSKSSK